MRLPDGSSSRWARAASAGRSSWSASGRRSRRLPLRGGDRGGGRLHADALRAAAAARPRPTVRGILETGRMHARVAVRRNGDPLDELGGAVQRAARPDRGADRGHARLARQRGARPAHAHDAAAQRGGDRPGVGPRRGPCRRAGRMPGGVGAGGGHAGDPDGHLRGGDRHAAAPVERTDLPAVVRDAASSTPTWPRTAASPSRWTRPRPVRARRPQPPAPGRGQPRGQRGQVHARAAGASSCRPAARARRPSWSCATPASGSPPRTGPDLRPAVPRRPQPLRARPGPRASAW